MHAADAGADRGRVVLVPGLWFHSSCWQPWIEEFDRSGYDCTRFQWPGELSTPKAGRKAASGVAPVTMTHVLDELTRMILQLDRRPIVIGHGLGGLMATVMLTRGLSVATISLAPVPNGRALLPAVCRLRQGRGELIRLATSRRSLPTPVQWTRRFANTSTPAEAARLYRGVVQPHRPHRVLLSSVVATSRDSSGAASGVRSRGPFLIAGGGRDQLVHEVSLNALHLRSRRRSPESFTDLQIFPDRDHCLTMDSRWRSVAFHCLDWLTAHNL